MALPRLTHYTNMTWGGPWDSETAFYERGVMVTDGGWLMICRRRTNTKAGPVLVGDPIPGLPVDPTWTDEVGLSTILSGQRYTITSGGVITEIRCWIPDTVDTDLTYYLIVSDVDTGDSKSAQLDISGLSAPGWLAVDAQTLSKVIIPTATLDIALYVTSEQPVATNTFQYVYDGNVGTSPPVGDWNRQGDTILRINLKDDGGTGRGAALNVIAPGDEIDIVETLAANRNRSYRVDANLGQTADYFEYTVTLLTSQVPIRVGNLCDLSITVFGGGVVNYVEELNYWPGNIPSWASNVEGILQTDTGSPLVQSTTVYGIDITFQELALSDDWEVMSFTELSTVGAGGLAAFLFAGVNQTRNLSELLTGHAQQQGAGTITVPAINTWVDLDPATTLLQNSAEWSQPADAQLGITVDHERLARIAIIFLLDVAIPNQTFELRAVIDGTPIGQPIPLPLVGNKPQEYSFGFDMLIAPGLSTLAFEVQNTSSAQDLEVLGFLLSVSDTLAAP